MILPWLIIVPLAGILGVLFAARSALWQAIVILATSLVSLGLSIGLFTVDGPILYAVGGWEFPIGILLRIDGLSRLMLLLTGVLFSLAGLYHLGQTRQGIAPTDNPIYHLSYPLILLALNGLFMTGDFFNFYVFFELVAVSSYLLVSLGNRMPLEAAWKYSAQSVVGSIFLLVGVVSLYGETGALEMTEVSRRLTSPAMWAAPFFLIAFFLKGAIFPFHFWQPDAYAAATPTGSVVLAGLLTKVGLYGLLRFWPLLMGEAMLETFVVIGAVSILFGATAAWRQSDAKRMLGFSSISQLGFVLMGMGWGTVGALGAAIFYLISHSLSKALLFMATGLVAQRSRTTRFSELTGKGGGLPWVGAAYLIGGLSLVGFPPTLGFMAKIRIINEGIGAMAWGWVAIAAIGSLLTAGYIIRSFQRIFWEVGSPAERPAFLVMGATMLTMSLVVLGLFGSEGLWNACLASARELRP